MFETLLYAIHNHFVIPKIYINTRKRIYIKELITIKIHVVALMYKGHICIFKKVTYHIFIFEILKYQRVGTYRLF